MSGGGGGWSGPDSRVETISRLAQWRVDTFGPCSSYRRSDPFKLGIWNWYLSVEKSRSIYVRLFPEPGRLSKEQPPLARFVLRVSWAGPPRRSHVSPVLEQLLRSSDDFAWQVDVMAHGRFTIDVEFLDLRVATNNASILSFSTYQSRKNPAYFFRTFDRLLNAVTSMNWKIHQVSIPSEHLPSANIMLM